MRVGLRGTTSFGRSIVVLLLVAATAAALAAPVGRFRAAAQDGVSIQTRVQVLHAATDLGKAEVHFNNDEALDEFEYGDLSEWIDLDPGTVRVTITRDRAGINYYVFDVVYPVPAGNDYYLIITDALVMGSVAQRDPLPDGAARIRVTHASVDTPAVNVVATGTDLSLASQLAYGQSSEYTEVPAGSYDAEIRLADTGEVLASITGGAIEAGKSYEFVIVGTPGDDDKPLIIQPLVDDVQVRDASTPGA
jgi:hypothetical protein